MTAIPEREEAILAACQFSRLHDSVLEALAVATVPAAMEFVAVPDEGAADSQ